MTEQPNREVAVLNAALEFRPAERAAYLDQACTGDAALRQQVEALLHAHEQAEGFLEAPLAGLGFNQTVRITVPLTEKSGDRIGRYKLLQQIGEGGCGTVYMAEKEVPVRRRVALKVIKLGMDTKSVIARFEAERQALAMMDHPNIAKVLDAGTTETGRPYFVMELVRGTKITEYCDEAKLSTRERLNLFVQVCQAVQHAHQKGIIHRDIKPSNILVTVNDGVSVPKVIDFGIAKATNQQQLTDKTVFTAFEQFIGTPAYMSPEQAVMTSLDIDTRSDIYSLGVLLYELLAGSTPFDANELMASGIDAMRKTIREKEPIRPSTRLATLQREVLTNTAKRRSADTSKLLHQLKGDLDWIVMKCLEKDRARRYDTANGLAMDLKRHLSNEPVVARPPSSTYRFRKLVRRNKLAVVAAAAVATALLLGMIVSTWQAVRATRAKREALSAQVQAVAAQASEAKLREAAQAQELAARRRAYAADMNVAKQALDDNNLGRAFDLLKQQRPQPGQKDLRGWEWRYLWGQTRSDSLFTLCQEATEINSLAVSPDGKLVVATVVGRGGLSLWDVPARREVIRLAETEGDVRAVMSLTEPLLLFTGTETSEERRSLLHLWNTTTRQMIAERPLDADCKGLAMSKDGRTFVTSTHLGHITLWSLPDVTQLASYPCEQSDTAGTSFAATSDLGLAAYGSPEKQIRIIDLHSGQERSLEDASKGVVTALAFSPDGMTLASSGDYQESDIRLWDVATGKEIGRLEGHRAWVSSLVFWPDGKKLASSSADQTIRIWDVAGRKCVDTLRGHRQEVWRLALMPDQNTLVSGCKNGTVCFWDTSVTHPRPARDTFPEPIFQWNFAPDGQSVLTFSKKGRVTRWKGRDFQQPETLLDVAALGGSIHFACRLSPDGHRLAIGSTNGVIQIWDIPQHTLWRQWTNTSGFVGTYLFLANGSRLLIFSKQGWLYHEWNLDPLSEIQAWQLPASLNGAGLSPNERLFLAVGYDGDAVLRNLADKSSTQLNLDFREADDVNFSPDGRLVAGSSSLGFARVWDARTWREVVTLGSFMNGASGNAFSPDSTRLVVAGSGRDALRIWDTESWLETLTLNGEGASFWPVLFSPDGNAIGSINNASGVLQIWRAPSWEEINTAEAKDKTEIKQL